MQHFLNWIGYLLSGIGIALTIGGGVLQYMGYGASYNIGDPAKFEFILVPFWTIGIAVGLVGALSLLLSRRAMRPR